MTVRTSLAGAPSGFTPEQLSARQNTYERDLWIRHGAIVIRPELVVNEWERRIVQNIAERMYGRRGK